MQASPRSPTSLRLVSLPISNRSDALQRGTSAAVELKACPLSGTLVSANNQGDRERSEREVVALHAPQLAATLTELGVAPTEVLPLMAEAFARCWSMLGHSESDSTDQDLLRRTALALVSTTPSVAKRPTRGVTNGQLSSLLLAIRRHRSLRKSRLRGLLACWGLVLLGATLAVRLLPSPPTSSPAYVAGR